MNDVVIVGGGIIGLSTAWELSKRGAVVRVLDQSSAGRESSWAGAGMLPPFNLDHTGPWSESQRLIEQLRSTSNQDWPAWTAELLEQSGIVNGFAVCGAIELEPHEQEWTQAGIRFEIVNGAAVHSRFPFLAPSVSSVAFVPDYAQVRNPWQLRALKAACHASRVTIDENCPVESFEFVNQRAVAIRTRQGERIAADAFVIAAGAWSSQLLDNSIRIPTVKPIRGQIVLLKSDRVAITPVVECGLRYLVPRGDGHILVGSTEESAGFDKRTTAAVVAELITFACGLVPELESASVESAWSGLRPYCSSHFPLIGRVPSRDNLYLATGHHRNGLQLSIVTAKMIADSITGKSHPLADACQQQIET